MNPQDSQELRNSLRGLKRPTLQDFRYPIEAYEDELVEVIEAYVTTRVKEAVDNYHNEITADETRVWISRADFEQRVKEAERLARLDELEQLAEYETKAIGVIHGRHKRSYDDRIEALTTTTNGKE